MQDSGMNFTPLFSPKTVAVIGVSTTNDRHPANVVYNKNHLHYPADVFAINPKGGTLQGRPVLRTLAEAPRAIDLAVIAVRAESVPEALEACIAAGVGGAAIISGGFAEVGRKALQQRLVAAARSADFPFIGPNCLGIYAPGRVDTFFLPSERMVRPQGGNVAIVSQSGGILMDQLVKFAVEGIGVTMAVSIGNKAFVRELDLLRYLEADPATRVIAFYVEGFGPDEGRAFVRQAASASKPVVMLKAGKSEAGRRAVSSHTAALAGDYRVFSQVMAQHGIVEADNEYELVSFCEALSRYPRRIDGRIGIITSSGGHGALAVDACYGRGLDVPHLASRLQEDVRRMLSPSIRQIASVSNPMDLTGSAVDEDFVAAVSWLSSRAEIDCILLLLLPYSPGITMDLGARLSRIFLQSGKPMIAYVPYMEKYRMLIEGFELHRVPVAHSIEGAVLMAEAMKRCQPC
jgi:acetyltransferase